MSSTSEIFLSLLTILQIFSFLLIAIPISSGVVDAHQDNLIVHYNNNYTEFVINILDKLNFAPQVKEHQEKRLRNKYFLSHAKSNGLWLEFGSATGHSTRQFGKYLSSTPPYSTIIYGFDSFLGLPEKWNGFNINGFTNGGKVPFNETKNLKWVVGWYNESFPKFLQSHNDEKISFIHIDCDLYSSTKTVFDQLVPRLLDKRLMIMFDELINYESFKDHEIKAFWEFLGRYPNTIIEVIGVCTTVIPIQYDFQRLSQTSPYGQCAAFVLHFKDF